MEPPANAAAAVDPAPHALGRSGLPALRDRVVEIAARRTAADAVFILDLAAPGRRIVFLAGGELGGGAALTAAEPDLELLLAAQTTLVVGARRRRGTIAELLGAAGYASAVVAGLGIHGVDQLLVAARRHGRFAAPAQQALAELAAVLAGAEKQHHVARIDGRRFRQQAAIAALGQEALAGHDLDALTHAACAAAAEHLDADVANVFERTGDGLVIRAAAGGSLAEVGLHISLQAAFSARVVVSGEPLVISDVTADPMYARATLAHSVQAASLASVPIQSGRRTTGALTVVSRTRWRFTEHDITFLQGLANVVALAAEGLRVQNQLRLSVEELRKSAEDRSRLLAHIVEAQEEERRRIADDIHDDSVQVMTAVALRLATLRRRFGGDTLDPLLTNLEHDVRQSIGRLRRLMFVLRPPALENQGVASALHAFLAQVADDAGLTYTLEDRIDNEPETAARIVVYRIAQEAVANVIKHARASRIDVTLEEDVSGILVTIKDDGAGFDPSQREPMLPGRLGIMAMRERAEQTGGWCIVDSEPGQGTTVRYCVGSNPARRLDPPSGHSVVMVR